MIAESELISVAYDRLDPSVHRPTLVLTTNGWAYQRNADSRLFPGAPPATPDGTLDLLAFIADHKGRIPESPALKPDDVAMLVYTSGTSGTPKGAMNLHRGVGWGSQLARRSQGLPDGVVTLAIAPLFHIADSSCVRAAPSMRGERLCSAIA